MAEPPEEIAKYSTELLGQWNDDAVNLGNLLQPGVDGLSVGDSFAALQALVYGFTKLSEFIGIGITLLPERARGKQSRQIPDQGEGVENGLYIVRMVFALQQSFTDAGYVVCTIIECLASSTDAKRYGNRVPEIYEFLRGCGSGIALQMHDGSMHALGPETLATDHNAHGRKQHYAGNGYRQLDRHRADKQPAPPFVCLVLRVGQNRAPQIRDMRSLCTPCRRRLKGA